MSTCHLHPTKSFNVLGFSRMGQTVWNWAAWKLLEREPCSCRRKTGSCKHATPARKFMFIDVCALRSKLKLKFHYPNDMILWLLNLRNALRNPHFLLGTWFMSWFWLASGTTEEPDHIPPSHFWWLDLGGRKGRLFQSIFPQLPPMSAKWVFKCAKLAPGKKKNLRIRNDSQKWKDLFFTQKSIHSRNKMETSGSFAEYYSQRWTCSSGPVLDTRSTEIDTNQLSFETCVQLSTVPWIKL